MNLIVPPLHWNGKTYYSVDEARVRRALFDHSKKKAPGPDRLDFSTVRLLWKQNAGCITELIRKSICLGHHPGAGKHVKGIMLQKPNTLDYTVIKSYCIISVLNCLGKTYKKVVANMLFEWCEVNQVLHDGQMGFWTERSVINTIARMVATVQWAWAEGKLAGILLIHVKGIFNHISRNCLLHTTECLGADGDQMRWTVLFMSDTIVGQVIDGNQCEETAKDTGVPQGLPVSPKLFGIYPSGVFKK